MGSALGVWLPFGAVSVVEAEPNEKLGVGVEVDVGFWDEPKRVLPLAPDAPNRLLVAA